MTLPVVQSPPLATLLQQSMFASVQTQAENLFLNPGTGINGQPLAPLPATSWGATSWGPYIINLEALAISTLSQYVVVLGNAVYLSTSSIPIIAPTGVPNQTPPTLQYTAATAAAAGLPNYYVGTSPWTDAQLTQSYNTSRGQPVTTILTVTFSAAAGVGPTQVTTGQLTVTDGAGNYYSNIALPPSIAAQYLTAGTIPLASGPGQLVVAFSATVPGAQANIANSGQALSLVTQLPGVTVQTWAATPIGSFTVNASALVQTGANIESDASCIARGYNQWGTMSSGSPGGAMSNWCFATSSEVRFATTQATGLGTISVYVYGGGAPVSSAGLAAIAQFMTARFMQGTYLAPGSPMNAVTLPVNPSSTSGITCATVTVQVWGPQSAKSAGVIAIANALASLINNAPVGGYPIAPGVPDLFGIANSAFVDATGNAAPAATRIIVNVGNYRLGTLQPNSGAGADLLMPTASGVPVVSTLANPFVSGVTIIWTGV